MDGMSYDNPCQSCKRICKEFNARFLSPKAFEEWSIRLDNCIEKAVIEKGSATKKFQSYYDTPGVRAICHALKQDADIKAQQTAIRKVADYMSQFVSSGDILLPAPSHTGRATYMLNVANMVARSTGAEVMDILTSDPHKPLYDRKKTGEEIHLEIKAIGAIPQGKKVWFVDNVYATGTTYKAAQRALPGSEIDLLVFAVDFSINRGIGPKK